MPQPIESRQMNILLVDDSTDDVRLIWEALREAKVSSMLYFVGDGIEVFEFLRRQGKYKSVPRPDLILLDLYLPKKDGRDVLFDLKLDPDFKYIPVVVLTTSEAEADIIETYNLHANCYIKKPVDLDQFTRVVQGIGHFWFGVASLPEGGDQCQQLTSARLLPLP